VRDANQIHPRGRPSARSTWRAASATRPRPAIGKYPDGADGRQANATAFDGDVGPPASRPTIRPTCRKVDYDLWLGPAPKRPVSTATAFTYKLALALGLRQRRQRQPGSAPVRYRAPGGLQEAGSTRVKNPLPTGGYFSARRSSQETPNLQTSPVRVRPTAKVLEFGTRGGLHERRRRREDRQTCSTVRKGWLWIEEAGKTWQSYFPDRRTRKGPAPSVRPTPATSPTGLTTTEYPHYQNFIDAIPRPAIRSC